MSLRPRRLLLFGLPAAVLLGLLAAWWLWPRTVITADNAAKIRPGMTLAEVEAILGGPARDESTGPLAADLGDETPADARQRRDAEEVALMVFHFSAWWDGTPHWWQSDCVMVHVSMDRDGKVLRATRLPVRRAEERPLDRLRRWLGL
jgi:hypothetical protein